MGGRVEVGEEGFEEGGCGAVVVFEGVKLYQNEENADICRSFLQEWED